VAPGVFPGVSPRLLDFFIPEFPIHGCPQNCQPPFHFWVGPCQTLKLYLHNCQSDIKFEGTDLGLTCV